MDHTVLTTQVSCRQNTAEWVQMFSNKTLIYKADSQIWPMGHGALTSDLKHN